MNSEAGRREVCFGPRAVKCALGLGPWAAGLLLAKPYVWLCRAMYGCLWLCMAVYGYVWLCMAMYGYVWICMAMYGYIWLCSVVPL